MGNKITANYIRLKKLANNPPQPPSGEVYFFAKSNGRISLLDDTNTEVNMTGSANALNDLSDVTITAASEGEYLAYSGGAFVDTAFPSIPANIGDFSDVDTTGAVNTDILMYTTSFKPKKQKPSVFAYTTSSLSLTSSTNNILMPINHANVSTSGDTDLEGTNYFQRYDDGGDLDDDGLYLLETWFSFSTGGSGNVTITPVTITGSTPTLPSGGSVTDPYITAVVSSSFVTRLYVQYAFHPPHADPEHSWMFDNGVAATVNYTFRSIFRKLGHNTSNTALFDSA